MKDAVTIYDIAKEAGVSAATVSRVMNGTGYVGKDTKRNVEAIIERYQFKPNAIARGLTSKQSRTIGMLVPDVRNPYFAAMFVQIEEAALEQGYNVILCNTLNDIEKDIAYLDMLLQKQVDVLIPLGGQLDESCPDIAYMDMIRKASEKIPVLTTGQGEGRLCLQLSMDDTGAMEEVLHTLWDAGHRRFAMIGGHKGVVPTDHKYKIFETILTQCGIANKDCIVRNELGYDVSDGREGVRQLELLQEFPTVFFGINEFVTTGIMMELQQLGRMDGSIEVIGFDNTYVTQFTSPSMTCIGVDYKEYADKAIDMIQRCLQGEDWEQRATIQSKVTVRESARSLIR